MRFTKMHGAGNDYVYVNAFDERLPDDLPALARALSDRHTGVGGDGLIVVAPSTAADVAMRVWNADGSEAEMCGNGARCVAKLAFERGLCRRLPLRIETGRGVLTVDLDVRHGAVTSARVAMGRPILEGRLIPTTLPGDPPVMAPLDLADRTLAVTCVSMGNPHAVVFVDRLDDETVALGPSIERHPAFPRRTNVEFVRVDSRQEAAIRVWERGSGETRACGTGACAAVVAGILVGRLERTVTCALPGGELCVVWDASGETFLSGPAVEVFRGEIALPGEAIRAVRHDAA